MELLQPPRPRMTSFGNLKIIVMTYKSQFYGTVMAFPIMEMDIAINVTTPCLIFVAHYRRGATAFADA
jgi:hypothetical protein